MTVPSQFLQQVGVFNAMVPNEGPKCLPVNGDFRTSATQEFDFTNQIMSGFISFIQGVYVDNSGNDQPLTLSCGVSNMSVTIGAGRQQFTPLIIPNPPKVIGTTTGGVIVPLYFLNVPMPIGLLDGSSAPSFEFDDSGYLLVSAPNLEALINDLGDGPALNVNVVSGGGGGGGSLAGLPVASFQLTSGPQTLLSATGAGARFRLTGILITVDPTIFNTSDGDSEYGWSIAQASTRTLFRGNFFLPKRAPIINGQAASNCQLILSATAFDDVGTVDNEVLRWNQPASISGGFFNCTVYGTPNYVP